MSPLVVSTLSDSVPRISTRFIALLNVIFTRLTIFVGMLKSHYYIQLLVMYTVICLLKIYKQMMNVYITAQHFLKSCLSVNIWSVVDRLFLNTDWKSPCISSVYVSRYCVTIYVNILYIIFIKDIPI